MPTARERKHRAKQLLQGNWLIGAVAVAVVLTTAAVVSLCVEMAAFAVGAQETSWMYTLLCAGGALFGLFTVCPLWYGLRRRAMLTAVGNFVPLSEIFTLFGQGKRYFRYIGMCARIFVRAAAAGLVLILPGAVGAGLLSGDYIALNRASVTLLSWSTALCFLLGGLLSVWVLARYFLCDYLFALHPDSKTGALLRDSAQFMRGRMAELLELIFHFLPWFLLGLTGISIPFVLSYYEMSAAVLARDIVYGEDFL